MHRRDFVSALAAIAALSEGVSADQRSEVETYWAEVPPGATLWAFAVFLTDEPVEFTVGTAKENQTLRGRFDGRRLQEYSWRNTGTTPQRVAVRAKALAGERELEPSHVRFISEQHVYVAFGRRGVPDDPASRRGAYPFEAVFVGFITFGN
jgi:predicted Zn-dependent protease with MMP-like domain